MPAGSLDRFGYIDRQAAQRSAQPENSRRRMFFRKGSGQTHFTSVSPKQSRIRLERNALVEGFLSSDATFHVRVPAARAALRVRYFFGPTRRARASPRAARRGTARLRPPRSRPRPDPTPCAPPGTAGDELEEKQKATACAVTGGQGRPLSNSIAGGCGPNLARRSNGQTAETTLNNPLKVVDHWRS